jgi:hypothetical protein
MTMPFPPSPVKGETFLGADADWGAALFAGFGASLEELWLAVLEQAL